VIETGSASSSTERICTVTNGVFPSNCYLCRVSDADECFIVDPGLEPGPIQAALNERGWWPRAVLCTHGHFDHTGSTAHFQRAYGCPVLLHHQDQKTLRSSNFLLMAFKIPARMAMPEVTPVAENELAVNVAGAVVRFHPAPGHTPGSCVLEFEDSLFTGDTLYTRGVGLSQLPGEDAKQLRRSILSLWDRFPDHAIVRPGHGEAAELGWLKRNNTALLRFLQEEPCPTTKS
jgi:glyoxylase-like metal-dependent hydrolase (beta-lactamase superfamily II)